MAKAQTIPSLSGEAKTSDNARIIVYTRLEELYSWNQYVDNPYHVHELHNMRIAAKRLRYSLEIFNEHLPAACKPIISEVEQIQEELGSLHDSDVMIALLRLCLGSQDSGSGYEYLLSHAEKLHAEGKFTLNPAFVAHLVDSSVAPDGAERQGLELFLRSLVTRREDEYHVFRQHWYELKERDFYHEVHTALEA